MIKRATTVLVLSLVCCSGLAPPIGLKRTTTPTQGWTARKHWKSVLRASTPPHGDYDYDYGYNGNDGVDQRTLPPQGEEVDAINVSGDGQAAGAAATAAPGPVAAVTERPAFGTAAEGRDPTHDIRGRAISIGQLFGRTATTTKKTKRVSGPKKQQQSGTRPPGLVWRAGVKGMVPLATAIGLSVTPSRYLAVRAAGGAVLAIAANVLRQAVVATRKRQAPDALLELVRKEGAGNVTREQLMDLAEKYFVKGPELWGSSRLIYSSVLADTVAEHEPNTEDLGRLVMLKWTLGLSSQEVASCHHKVVEDAVSSVGAPVSMDKMLYLSERMFYQEGTTDEGYLDECARLRSQLGGMSQVDLLRKVTQYAAPCYQSVLEDVTSRPESFSGEVLLRTRRRLGVSEVVAGGMHLDIYQSAIQRLLDTNGRLDDRDRLWLSRLRGIMSVSQFEGERALESVTAPVYREAIQAAFAEAVGLQRGEPGVDALRAKLRSRQADLQLTMAAADAVVKETIRKLALRSLEVALVAMRNGGGGGPGGSPESYVLRSMTEVFQLREAVSLLVQNTPDADCSRYFTGVLVGSPSLRLAESEKRAIFRIQLEHALEDAHLDEDDKGTLAELGSMLQLAEADVRQIHVSVVNPLLSRRLAETIERKDFTAQDVAKLQQDLTVPADTFLDTCMEAYHAKLTNLLEEGEKSRGPPVSGVISDISDTDKAALDSAAEALGLSKEQLYTIHDITCGPVLKAAALELLTAVAEAEVDEGDGQQPETVAMALKTSRDRLGMSKDGARAAFVGAFFEVVAPNIQEVSVAIEALKDARKGMPKAMPATAFSSASPLLVNSGGGAMDDVTTPALADCDGSAVGEQSVAAVAKPRNGEGLGHAEELGMRADEIMGRVLRLASLCERAGASKELEVVLRASTTGRSDPLYSEGVGQAVGSKPALSVYTFFLEEAFSPRRDSLATDDPVLQKRDSLALALGLSKARTIDVHRGVSSRLYLDFLHGKLERKWALGAVDTASLKAIEEVLGMTGVVCEELMARGTKSFVRRRVEEERDPAVARAMLETRAGTTAARRTTRRGVLAATGGLGLGLGREGCRPGGVSLVMSAGGVETRGFNGEGSASGGGCLGGLGEGCGGLTVGAEGVFPVEIGFITGELDDDGVGAADKGMVAGREMGKRVREAAQDKSPRDAAGTTMRPEGQSDEEASVLSFLKVLRGRRGVGEGADDASGLGSWAADFGLFVGEDGTALDGTSSGEVESDFVGWGASFEDYAWMGLGVEEEGEAGRDGEAAAADFGSAAPEPTTSAHAMKAPTVEDEEDYLKTWKGEGVVTEDKDERETGIVAEDTKVAGARSTVRLFAGRMNATLNGQADLDAAGLPRAGGNGKRDSSSGFLAALASLSSNREPAKLKAAVRAAGGELYSLTDRLSILSSALGKHPLAAPGKGAASVAAALEEVASLRRALKAGEYSRFSGRPEEVRRAVKAAERLVRDAERAVGKDIAVLDNAASREATALAEISACREKLEAARARLRSADTLNIKALPVLWGALGKVQASVDVCAERLRQSSSTPLQGGRAASGAKAGEPSLATCKAKVRAVVAKVDAACAKRRQHEQPHRPKGGTQDETSRRAGDRWLMQARALRRAMLGPEGIGRRRGTTGGNQLQEALDKLDAALAEADRLRADTGILGSPQGGAAYEKAARGASHAAEELQRAAETVASEHGTRLDRARALVSMALGEVTEMEADATDCGLVGSPGVPEALGNARRGLERMYGTLQKEERAGVSDQSRVETLVASGSLESALRGVDTARAAVTLARRIEGAEAEARAIIDKERARVDDLSLQAQALGLLGRPAVARAVNACREAGTAAGRRDSRGRQVSPEECEALAQDFLSAARLARGATERAQETIKHEREAAAVNDGSRCRAKERLESSKAALAVLHGRVDRLATSAEQRRASLERMRVLTASWKFGGADGKELRRPIPPESLERSASRATAEAKKGLDAVEKEAEASGDATGLDKRVESSLQRLTVAEAAVAAAEVRGRRRGNAVLALERAAARTEAVIADAEAAKVARRSAVVGSLTAAVREVRVALCVAVGSAADDELGPRDIEHDDAVLAAAGLAEQAAEAAGNRVARERAAAEREEEERQERCAELWSAARRLEGLDTDSVVADDPEAAAMVLEARSEAVNVLMALEAAEDPSDLLDSAQAALEKASLVEENLVETQRTVCCFDDAASFLEQAEGLVEEAQATIKARDVPAASRAAFQEALERYESVLSVAAGSSDGADAFLERCTAAFAAARGVDRAAVRANRRVRAHKERLRRELNRLDRPAAALLALDLSELTETSGTVSFREVAQGVRDALSAVNSARTEVEESSKERSEAQEAVLADRVDSAVQAAATAEREFREAREVVRRMNRGWQQLAGPEAALARTREDIAVLPHAGVVSELCEGALQGAEDSLAAARAGVAAIGRGGRAVVGDVEAKVEEAKLKTTRVQSAASQRQMLRSALETSGDSIAEAQAGLEAELKGRSPQDSISTAQAGLMGRKGDPMSEALRACAAAEEAASVARECLERPLSAESFRAGTGDAAKEAERAVDAAQTAAAEAEQAAARLVERLGQIRGIRAKLRSLLAQSEARFRRASAALADAGVVDSKREAVRVASAALARARDRLRSSLGSGYLAADGGRSGGGRDDGGRGTGSLARDEEAVSEATGFVEALELIASRGAKTSPSPAERAKSGSSGETGHESMDALALALQWGDALRAQVAELQLGGDPAVAQALEETGKAAVAAERLWSPGERREGSGAEGRAAVEGLAAQLGELERFAEEAAEKRRTREAERGAAARRLDRLTATFNSLQETVNSAGEPLLASLTDAALSAAHDAITAASATANAGVGLGDGKAVSSARESTLADAVQAAAVAVAQAEATVTRARERAPQVSAERVRALQTLVGLAETLSEAGEQLASSSAERGLPSSREAAAAISQAQAGLSRARAAAQADGGAWMSGAAAITDVVAEAGELVRRAKRAADGPAAAAAAVPRAGRPASRGEDTVAAEAEARAWYEEEVKGGAKTTDRPNRSDVGGVEDQSSSPGTTDARKARIGFSKKGEGAQTYLPLWMRLQKKLWDTGAAERDGVGGSDDLGRREAASRDDTSPRPRDNPASPPPATATNVQRDTPPSGSKESRLEAGSDKWRRKEEERLGAEVKRLRAEAARLRARRDRSDANGAQGSQISGAGGAGERRGFKQAAEALAEDMVKDFATRAKKVAQQRDSNRASDSGKE
ncbi:conserved unknown protein [Ectocarpus siliculosus]|uniref:Uncharacterized protein n=1 Tax=Ectocarpus siliculosus TaxID=2880 RepID=D7G576_ECTSI|nr:conserved unknown protein [Ectocarpus siliculosus]|eukprot:CBJ27230.1 conserved unknown protein [Ectocarpus siliculosus]